MEPVQSEKKTEEKFDFKNLHFGWFVGHALTVVNAFVFFASQLLFRPCNFFYRVSYLGVIASYGIVLYNSYKPLGSNESYFKRMLLDENAQYLIVAVYFLLTRRIAITLLPFFIYSVFHVLEYTEKTLIPALAPHQTKVQTSIRDVTSKYHDKAMELTSKIEVVGVMTRLVLGLFVFRSSILSVLIYAQFLRMRFYMSTDTRDFLTDAGSQLDRLLTAPTAHPKIPPAVINAYATVKEKLGVKPILANTATTDATKKQL